MSFASRDPYWRARVLEETRLHQAAKPQIEDKCLRCHAAAYQHPLRSASTASLAAISANGRDGVSCTVCHRISRDSLRPPASFTGGFDVAGVNAIFGPHAAPFEMPMLHHTGFRPAESQHMLSAELCGSCHTLIIQHEGSAFVEQAPYLEWRASDYPAHGMTCISCHMPLLANAAGDAATQYIAHRPPGGWFPPTEPRAPFRLHSFRGGNTPLVRTMAAIDGGVPADSGALLTQAASLRASGTVRNGTAKIEVIVTNKTGHKLPTGFPGRRMWLHVQVLDGAGVSIFDSGGWNEVGELACDPQPHRWVVSSPNDAVVYEARLADEQGRPTTSLVSARRFAKDNRILPAGFGVAAERDFHDAIVPIAVAGDAGFIAGSHTSRFDVKVGSSKHVRVLVGLVFQSAPPAELTRLTLNATPDLSRELRLFRQNAMPVVIASREFELFSPQQIQNAPPKRPQSATR